MDDVKRVLDRLLELLLSLGAVIVNSIIAIELWIRNQLTGWGVPAGIQTAVLVVLAIVLVALAFRLFGGLVRIAIIILLALIALHILMPVLHA